MMNYILNRLKLNSFSGQFGYSLIELMVVIIIISIIAATTVSTLKSTVEIARFEETKTELQQLANAITGDQDKISGGNRIDFGYVGDIGSMPPNLDALVSNPGSYTTWNGPYIRDDYYSASGSAAYEYKIDAWGKPYSLGSFDISSTGNGTPITQQIAQSNSAVLYNQISVVVLDLDNSPPGATYRDSVSIILTYPDGSGAYTNSSRTPSADGFVSFDSIPIGNHSLTMVYTPTTDSLRRTVSISPGQDQYLTIRYFGDVW